MSDVIERFIKNEHNSFVNDSECVHTLSKVHPWSGRKCSQCQSAGHFVVCARQESDDDLSLCFKCVRLFVKYQTLITPRWLFHKRANSLINTHDPTSDDVPDLAERPYEYTCEHCERLYVGEWDHVANAAICDSCRLCGTVSYFIERLIYLHRLQILPVDVCYHIVGMLFDHLAFSDSAIILLIREREHRITRANHNNAIVINDRWFCS